jgi:hypothetical protein
MPLAHPGDDAVEQEARRAGLVQFARAAAHLDNLRHALDLAAACSDLCAVTGADDLLLRLDAALRLAAGTVRAAVASEERRCAQAGIAGRRSLPSSSYDQLFTAKADRSGLLICVMRPGSPGYDPDYWEVVEEERD